MAEELKCEKCGKTGRVIKYDNKEFILCEQCLAGLNKIIEIWLEVKRNKKNEQNNLT